MCFYTAFIAVAFLYQSVTSKTVTHRTLELPTTINKEPKDFISCIVSFTSKRRISNDMEVYFLYDYILLWVNKDGWFTCLKLKISFSGPISYWTSKALENHNVWKKLVLQKVRFRLKVKFPLSGSSDWCSHCKQIKDKKIF